MNSLQDFRDKPFIDALKSFFKELKVPVNYIANEPASPGDLLAEKYKPNNPAHALIGDVFVLGMIDDAVFEGKENFESIDQVQKLQADYEGMLILGVILKNNAATRSQLAEITRVFNRVFPYTPVTIIFKYGYYISFANSERIKYKLEGREGEKVGKVIIVQDINTLSPHSGHLRILIDLTKPNNASNFKELLNHWLQVLDVSILNKKFFQELANWYFWAMDNVAFPDDFEKKKDIRNATNLIRLITRVIFIWFIKEKHLVPSSLFSKAFLEKILKDFNENNKSANYYKAILQNLFFGTLNQRMDERDFAEDHSRTNKLDQGIKNKYRYPDKFAISKQEIIALFKDVPFLNGGLFDCLDKFDEEKLEKGKKEQIFVDGFTRLEGKQAIVPDYLFFGEEREIDQTKFYDPDAKKPILKKVKGLIEILDSYKFTVAENTPIEEEVALDPELLGKVFENLLASYNPETQTTARKQTGSFYTPREIVNYMVDESLLEYLKSTVSIPAVKSTDSIPAVGDICTDSIPEVGFDENKSKDTFETFFDPANEIQIHQGNLPHWKQENVWFFITFRLADSIPADVVEEIKSERELWLKNHPNGKNGNYTKDELKEYYRLFSQRIETLLNAGKGSCVLKNESIAKIVAETLQHFNHQRYALDEWVIMPNHVHVLVKPFKDNNLSDILHSWKSFSANEINKVLGKKGQLWMHESYDHIVRNENAFHAIRNYIQQNPVKSGIKLPDCAQSWELNKSKDAFETFDTRLRDLFSYNENQNPFNDKETDAIIEAINNVKILDPATGSGAFPMGFLHKMVHILKKLDIGNVKWKAQQKIKVIGQQIKELEKDKEAIQGLSDKAVREKAEKAVEERLKEIDEIFESKNNFDDYARKLYLIENCIYGIDIQPIAVQISKLRFFISLIIDQNKDPEKENLGFRSLPNLETKFVAANTLISLEIPTTDLFSENNPIKVLQDELKAVRHEYFNAKNRKDKLSLQRQDKDLRKKIAATIRELLIKKSEEEINESKIRIEQENKKLDIIQNEPAKFQIIETTNIFGETEQTKIDKKKEKLKAQKDLISLLEKKLKTLLAADNKESILKVAEQISSFDPYDQNHFADWFEPEWMFGNDVKDGFDIVAGNPPYIKEYTFKDAFDGVRTSPYYQGKMDIWYLFACRNLDLLKKNTGVLCFIATNNWTTNSGASKMRNKVVADATIHLLLDFGSYMIFESADIQTMVMLFRNANKNDNYNFELRRLVGNNIRFDDVTDLIAKKQTEKTEYLNPKISKENFKDKTLTFSNDVFESILDKIKTKGNFVLTEDEVANGIHPHYDYVSKATQKVLGDKYRVGQGIFALSDNEKRDLDFNKKELELIKPFYATKHLHKWFGNSENDAWIIYTDSKFKYPENIKPYPNFKKHLDKFQKVITSDNKPYGLHRARAEYFFQGEKIIVLRKCAVEPIFTYTDFDCYVSATFYVIKSERTNQKYLTAVLNSKLIAFWLRNKGKMQGNNYQLDKEPLLQIPIYNAPTNEQQPIIKLVDKILSAKAANPKADTSELERQIDEMVYKLYELTEDEIKIIEGRK